MTIVIGYIATPEGRAALRHAQGEALRRGSRLIVVSSHDGSRDWSAQDAMRFADQLALVREELDRAGVDYELRTMVKGNTPAEDLVNVANEEAADYIVIGLRRRSAVGKLVLGSNAQQILLGADRPVIAVKADPSD